MSPILIRAYALSAYFASDSNRADAITALKAVLAGQYTTAAVKNGKVVTAVSEGGKTFNYTILQNLGPDQILQLAAEALAILNAYSDDEIEAVLLPSPRRSSVGRVVFC